VQQGPGVPGDRRVHLPRRGGHRTTESTTGASHLPPPYRLQILLHLLLRKDAEQVRVFGRGSVRRVYAAMQVPHRGPGVRLPLRVQGELKLWEFMLRRLLMPFRIGTTIGSFIIQEQSSITFDQLSLISDILNDCTHNFHQYSDLKV